MPSGDFIMAKTTLHKPNTKVGDYKIVEWVGRDSRATLYLAEKEDPEFRYWLMEFTEPVPARPTNEGQEMFDWKGNSVFTMPVAGTTAAALPRFVQQLTWQFLTPRFAKVAEEMAVRHDKGQLYQLRGSLSLENFFFNSDGTLSLYPASKVSNSPIIPPEGTSDLTPASDVFVVGTALQMLLAIPPQEKALLKGNTTLDAVLARATHPDPHARYPTAAGLALGLNGVAPAGIAASAVEENTVPWVSGCLVPLIVFLVLGAVGFGAYNAFLGQEVSDVQATATTRRNNNLVLATSVVTTTALSLNDLAIGSAGGGGIQASFLLLQNNEPLNSESLSFTVIHNDNVVADVSTQAQGGGRYTLTFNSALAPDNFFRVIAAVGNQNVSGSTYVFNSDVTGIDYETGSIAPPGLPRGPAITEPRDVPDPISAGNPFDFPQFFELFRANPQAEETSLDYMGDVTIQVDSSGYPGMVSYLSFRNTGGFPARLGGKVNIKVYQDGVEVPTFEIASVNPDEEPLTTALMIDVSGSMEGEPIAQARAAAEEFVRQLRPTDSVCLYTFATQITQVQACTSDHATTIGAIQGLQTVDDTSLYDALIRVATDQTALSGRQAIVVLSDGADTVSQSTLEEALATVQSTNIPLYLIGLVSEQFDGAVLQRLADETNGVYLQTPSAAQLRDLYLLTEVQLENQYRLSFESVFPEQQSGTLLFRFEDGDYQLDATKVFYAE
jgi:hypothetical protein